jgi:hypothetical protein
VRSEVLTAAIEVTSLFRDVIPCNHGTLKIEAADSCKIVDNIYNTTQRYNPEEGSLHSNRFAAHFRLGLFIKVTVKLFLCLTN